MEGRVLCGVGGFYTVIDEEGQKYTLRAQGKLRKQRLSPMAGDMVRFQPGQGEQHGWLEAILPRTNQLVRPPVANIDRLAIVISAGTPEPDLMLVDRMLIFARMNEIEPLIVAPLVAAPILLLLLILLLLPKKPKSSLGGKTDETM